MQLASYLNQLPEKPPDWHFHLSSDDYQKEVTVCVYNPDNIEMLHPRAQKLIKDEKDPIKKISDMKSKE